MVYWLVEKCLKADMQNFPLFRKRRLFSYLTIGIFCLIVILLGSIWFVNEKTANKPGGDYEAKGFAGSMNRAQIAYFLENGRFAHSVEALGILPDDIVVRSKIQKKMSLLVVKSNDRNVFHYSIPKNPSSRSYVGAIFLDQSTPFIKIENDGNLISRSTILCRAILPGTEAIAVPIDAKRCGLGTEKVVLKARD